MNALWYLSRATGVASIVLLTVVVVLGVVTAGRRRPQGEQATIIMAMHRWLSLGMASFLIVHIATAILDSYVSISALAAVVPFVSAYETVWVGLGTLAVDILIAILATSWFRHRIPERTWRLVHWTAYALWPLAIIHGLVLGTADQPLLLGITAACALVGVGAVGWRLLTRNSDTTQRAAALTQEWT